MSFRPRWFALALGTLLLLGADSPTKTLDIYFIDVMGGAATLIVTPERESLLIDTGWPGFEDRDPKRIAHVLKDVAGLDHLDHLVTTHWHSDHFGGVEGLAKLVRIDHFWDRGLPDPAAPDGDKAAFPDGPRADDPLGIAYRKASEGKRRALRPGDQLPLKGVEIVVLASGGEVIEVSGTGQPALCRGPARPEPDPTDNARSLAFRFRLGHVRLPRLRRPDLERRESPGLPGRPDRPDRPLPGHAPRDGDLEPPDPGPDDRADGRHHEQRPAQGGRPGDGQAARSRSPRSRPPTSSTRTPRPAPRRTPTPP